MSWFDKVGMEGIVSFGGSDDAFTDLMAGTANGVEVVFGFAKGFMKIDLLLEVSGVIAPLVGVERHSKSVKCL